jgi:cytochrome c biogenesis protein CcmG/thiol:disulfide interchange protein DsbE
MSQRQHIMRRYPTIWALAISAVCTHYAAGITPVRAQASSDNSATVPAKRPTVADPVLIDAGEYNRIVAKYQGKPLLVTFWATWCEPCRDEFPMFVQLAKKYSPQGLSIFGVSMDDNSDMNLVRHFLANNQPGFPNYRQKPGIDVDGFYHSVNPNWLGAMPETIFYGRDGRIAAHFIGEQTRATFERAIQAILATPPAGNRLASSPSGPGH